MTVLLLAAGAFVYWRVRIDLDTGLDRNLSEQFAATRDVFGSDGRVRELTSADVALASSDYQTLSADGADVSYGAASGATSLLSASQIEQALRGPIHVQVGALLPASPRPLRLLAARVDSSTPPVVLVVGVKRDQRDEALRELLATLAIAGFGALERALDRERTFVNDASHELRTPLTLLSARVQLLRRRPRSVAEHERALVPTSPTSSGSATNCSHSDQRRTRLPTMSVRWSI
jgi:signal transduction histidine kinase